MEITGVAGDRFSLPGCRLKLVGVKAAGKRREKLSGACIENEPPLQTLSGTSLYFREVPARQRPSGDEQGAGTARYSLPLSRKHLCFYLSSWAEERGCFGVPGVGKQPQHQPAPKPIEAIPLEAFHQLSQGVDEAPGAPDTMELRKKKRERNSACDVPTRSRYQLHYLKRVWYVQVKGTTYWELPLQPEGSAVLRGLLRRWARTRRGDAGALAISSAPGSETHGAGGDRGTRWRNQDHE